MSLDKYLPSKKFVIIAMSVAVAGTLSFVVYNHINTENQTAGQASAVPQGKPIILGQMVQQDTDHDGVPDWEEMLYGLDPTNPETVPGVPDLQTVANIRAAYAKAHPDINPNAPVTDTDQFAREFFTTILSLEQSGGMNPDSIKTLSDSFFSHIKDYPQETKYKASDINQVKDTSPNVNAYISSFAKTLKNPITDDISFNQVGLAVQTNDWTKLAPLAHIAAEYETVEKALIATKTPASAIAIQLNLANDYHKIAQNITDMSHVDTDPVPALAASMHYLQNIDTLTNDWSSLQIYINSIPIAK